MVFQGQAKKVSIRLVNGDGSLSGPICTALLTFLSPKDVCCLQFFDFAKNVAIQFLAKPSKTDALIQIAGLIAPGALIQVEDTTIVHAQSPPNREDLTTQRADWEASARR